jgi:hypothetical protein
MYTQSRLTFCLIHHTLLAPSPASSAIPASDHVPPDISRMPCASSTRRSHSQSSTDIGPLPMLFLVHHLACTMPWTVSGLHHALDRIRLAPCPGPYPACTMPWTISGLHHALDHIRLAPCPGPYPACTMPWTVSALRTSVLLGSLRHSGSSSALACSPIQPTPPGRCSNDLVKQSFLLLPSTACASRTPVSCALPPST